MNKATQNRSRAWMITLNFSKGTHPDKLTGYQMLDLKAFNRAAQVYPVTYCIFQGEVGEQGTYHVQAYAEFAQPTTMAGIKRHFGINHLHCEMRQGTQEEAIAYCSKEESRVSETIRFGAPMTTQKKSTGQGARNDWNQAWTQLKAGVTIPAILDKQPHLLPNVSALAKAQWEALRCRERKWKTNLIVLTGDARTGKSTTAVQYAKTLGSFYLMPNDGKAMWWNGYDPLIHDTVILDEFTGSKCPLTFLNQLGDEYPLRVQTKGGFVPFLARRIIITSNFEPHQWYDFANKEKNLCLDALQGRINTHVRFSLITDIDTDQRKLRLENVKGDFHPSHICSQFDLENPPTPLLSDDDAPPKISLQFLRELKRKSAEHAGVTDSDDEEPELNQTQNVKRFRWELNSDSSLDSSGDVDEDDASGLSSEVMG